MDSIINAIDNAIIEGEGNLNEGQELIDSGKKKLQEVKLAILSLKKGVKHSIELDEAAKLALRNKLDDAKKYVEELEAGKAPPPPPPAAVTLIKRVHIKWG